MYDTKHYVNILLNKEGTTPEISYSIYNAYNSV